MKKFLALTFALAAFAVAAFSVIDVVPTPRGQFAYNGPGGKLVAVEVFAPTNGTVDLKSMWSAAVYTNAVSIVTNGTGTLSVGIWSNKTTHVVYTNWYNSLRGTSYRYPYSMAGDTNLETTVVALVDVTTNTWPVIERNVAVTNDLASGSAAASVFTATPAGTNYLANGETLLYDGAGGGFLRLILE